MWQLQMQQLQQLNDSLQVGVHQQRGAGDSNSWRQDCQRGNRHTHQENSRDQHHGNSQSNHDNHRRDRGDFYHHDDRSGGRNRNYPPERRRDSRDASRGGRWKRF